MSLLDGCHELIDQHLNIDDSWAGQSPRYKHPTSLNHVEDNNLPDGDQLIQELFNQMVQNWEAGRSPANRSAENWRFERQCDFSEENRSPEVVLERTIINVVDEENWANQIPVDSGLLGGGRNLDLAFRAGAVFELIELKVEANTPLSAAFQILFYGLTNAFFRVYSQSLNTEDLETPLLRATEIRLRVLAPKSFYERFHAQSDWLKELENKLDKGLQKFSDNVLAETGMKITGFRFDMFPENFHWDQARHADDEHRKKVLEAVHRRHPCFS